MGFVFEFLCMLLYLCGLASCNRFAQTKQLPSGFALSSLSPTLQRSSSTSAEATQQQPTESSRNPASLSQEGGNGSSLSSSGKRRAYLAFPGSDNAAKRQHQPSHVAEDVCLADSTGSSAESVRTISSPSPPSVSFLEGHPDCNVYIASTAGDKQSLPSQDVGNGRAIPSRPRLRGTARKDSVLPHAASSLSSQSTSSSQGLSQRSFPVSRKLGGVRLRGRGRGGYSSGHSVAEEHSTAGNEPVVSTLNSGVRLRGIGVRKNLALRGAYVRSGHDAAHGRAFPGSSSQNGSRVSCQSSSGSESEGSTSDNELSVAGRERLVKARHLSPKKSIMVGNDDNSANGISRSSNAIKKVSAMTSQQQEKEENGKEKEIKKEEKTSVAVDDGSPISRSAAASLVATQATVKTPAKRPISEALLATSQGNSKQDSETPLSPVLTFHKNAFKVGDVVWAKMVDVPWWPAVVESIRSPATMSAAMQDLSLLFLGRKYSTQTTLLPTTLVAPFKENFQAKFLPKKRTSTYRRGVEEACELCDMEPPPLLETDKSTSGSLCMHFLFQSFSLPHSPPCLLL